MTITSANPALRSATYARPLRVTNQAGNRVGDRVASGR